jgi:hypothetical protein
MALGTLTLLAAQSYWLVHYDRSFKYAILATAILAVLTSATALLARRRKKLVVTFVVLWAIFVPVAWLLLFARRQNPYLSNQTIKFASACLLDLIAYVAARSLLPEAAAAASRSKPAPARKKIFGYASAFLLSYIFVLSPLLIYFSSPGDVGMTPAGLLARNLPAAALLGTGSWLVFRRLNPAWQERAAVAALALFLLVFTYAYLVPGDYGILDEFALEKARLLDELPFQRLLLDLLLAAAVVLGARYLLRRRAALTVPLLLAATLALVVQTTARGFQTDRGSLAVATALPAEQLPPESTEVHTFSRNGVNVVLVIADMFNGNYLGRLLEQHPEYRGRLDGFTWYRNTVSVSSHTATSLPAMFGGWNYVPERMNMEPGTGREKYERALLEFYDKLDAAGYRIAVVNPTYMDMPRLGEARYGGRLQSSDSDRYVGYWRTQHDFTRRLEATGRKNRLLVMVTLFQSAPYVLKARIYDNGSWLIFRAAYQFDYIARKTAGNLAYLDLLPDLSTVQAGRTKTFKFIHTQFTHEPFGITASGKIIAREFPDADTRSFIDSTSAFYTARKFLDLLDAWTDWMKRTGVFENTCIVVVADHGNNAMDNDLNLPEDLDSIIHRHEISRANALLLIKDLNRAGELIIDDRPMSNADTAAIVLAAAGIAGVKDPRQEELPAERARPFSSLLATWREFMASDSTSYAFYTVRGDMYDPQAWSRK